jgi:hypothetical protein
MRFSSEDMGRWRRLCAALDSESEAGAAAWTELMVARSVEPSPRLVVVSTSPSEDVVEEDGYNSGIAAVVLLPTPSEATQHSLVVARSSRASSRWRMNASEYLAFGSASSGTGGDVMKIPCLVLCDAWDAFCRLSEKMFFYFSV